MEKHYIDMKDKRWKDPVTSLLFYLFIPLGCIAAYMATKASMARSTVHKTFEYITPAASEVYIVWGLQDGSLPPAPTWPASSFERNNLVWSPTTKRSNRFSASLNLAPGSHYYYWMVHTKDVNGHKTEVWDSGGSEQSFFSASIPYGPLRPGYFIFLAGALPLLIAYIKNRKKPASYVPPGNAKISGYIPQLDAIRAFAVVLVIIHHWIPEKSWVHVLPCGPIGVNTFFVLSGFLITTILLKTKNDPDAVHGNSKPRAFRNFYARRTLRIFPIYYLLLIVFWMLKDVDLLKHPVYYFTYTANILFFAQERFPAHLAHLWSLAVEEQFYLVWPWLILLIDRRTLPYLIALFIVTGISTNYIFVEKGWWVSLLAPSCFDAFAIGGFLSFLTIFRPDIIKAIKPFYTPGVLLVLALFAFQVFGYSSLPSRTVHALLAAALIYYCLFLNSNHFANIILNNKWLIEIGKISYGIYLYHLFVPELWLAVNQKLLVHGIDLLYNSRVPATYKPAYLFVQEAILLLLLCYLSWIIIERPINGLKRYFPQTPVVQPASAVSHKADEEAR